MSPSDASDLRLLEIGHYVYAALTAFLCLIPAGMLAFILFLFNSGLTEPNPPPVWASWIVVAALTLLLAIGALATGVSVLAGRWIARRRRWTGCIIISALNCLNIPIGSALGIFTIIVLNREPVRREFEGGVR